MATADLATVRDALTGLVPFVGVLGPEFLEYEEGRALLRQPDRAELHNHVGGPHAGVLFTLAETASGARSSPSRWRCGVRTARRWPR